jgi:hypothetical protein
LDGTIAARHGFRPVRFARRRSVGRRVPMTARVADSNRKRREHCSRRFVFCVILSEAPSKRRIFIVLIEPSTDAMRILHPPTRRWAPAAQDDTPYSPPDRAATTSARRALKTSKT